MQPYIIVGQGIAGTILAWFFYKNNIPFIIYEPENKTSASATASGIINPVTGKRFVKSWLIDEVLPIAKATYAAISELLGAPFFFETPNYKLLKSVQHQNDIAIRFNDAAYDSYLPFHSLYRLPDSEIDNPYKSILINGGGWVDTISFLQKMNAFFIAKKLLIEQPFAINEHPNSTVIWCNGYESQSLFSSDKNPFLAAKGEHLFCEIPSLSTKEAIISGEVAISPTLQPDIYYVGATFEWNFSHKNPTPEKRKEIETKLRSFLKLPYKVTDHKAAIRPTTKDRRPLIGKLNDKQYIFNGFGTKGMSLTAYFADIFTQHILHHSPLPDEVNPLRF